MEQGFENQEELELDEEEINKEEIVNTLEDSSHTMGDMILTQVYNTFPIEQRFNRILKIIFSSIILLILVGLTCSIVYIVFKIGQEKYKFDEWTIRLFITGVFVEVIAVVKIIVSSLFPKDERQLYLKFINDCANTQVGGVKK